MIRSDSEYKEGLRRIEAERRSLIDHEGKLRAMGLTDDQIAAGMAPLRSFHRQFAEEVEQYARFQKRDLSCFDDLRDLGRVLVAARLATKMSGRALARKLGVDESQVSRDERNEYGGVSFDRACDILEALGVEVTIEYKLPPAVSGEKFSYSSSKPLPIHYAEPSFVEEPLTSSTPSNNVPPGRMAA